MFYFSFADDFGWDERMKVVTQLADLFSCMHENKIAFGFVNPHYIMIDKVSLNTWWSFISFGYLKIFLADFLIHV